MLSTIILHRYKLKYLILNFEMLFIITVVFYVFVQIEHNIITTFRRV